jgi:hypothetical protein
MALPPAELHARRKYAEASLIAIAVHSGRALIVEAPMVPLTGIPAQVVLKRLKHFSHRKTSAS